MSRTSPRELRRIRRKRGLRKRLMGTPEKPRLTVFRSLNHMYAQIVDDISGRTLVSASTRDKGFAAGAGGNKTAAESVGTAIAERAGKAGIKAIQFDRNGFQYHGRVKALADAVRKGGISF